jgi:thiol-disulfide isomerase/thioredoxin
MSKTRINSKSFRRFPNTMRYVYATTKWLLAAGAARITLFERVARGLGFSVAGTVLLIFLLIIPGPTTPVSAADSSLPAFGDGVVEVRVYTDYFCGPCRAEEQEVMSVITELVAKNRIRVILIDTPLYPETVLYAGYFLAAVNAKREFGQASRPGPPFSRRRGCRSEEKASWRASWQRRAWRSGRSTPLLSSRYSANTSKKTVSTQRPPLSSWDPKESKSWATRNRSLLRSAASGNKREGSPQENYSWFS